MFDVQEAVVAFFSSILLSVIQHELVVGKLEKKYMGFLGAICTLTFLIVLSNQKMLFTDVIVISAHKAWSTITISK